MLRIMTLGLCIAGCMLTGWRLADRLKRRYEALCDLRAGIQTLVNATAHTNRPLARIVRDISARSGLEFWTAFSERLSEGANADMAWSEALAYASDNRGAYRTLTQGDRALLKSFSETLGKLDRNSQTVSGRVTLDELSAEIEGAEKMYMQKGRIYRVLGLFMGLGLGIMIW